MAIIVSGRIWVQPGRRDEFLSASADAISAARAAEGCIDFAVSADVVDDSRVNIFEEWASRAQLEQFRGTGPNDSIASLIVRAEVSEREVRGISAP